MGRADLRSSSSDVGEWNSGSDCLDPGRDPVAGSRALLEDERLEEFLINALRLSQGFMLADFETATGLPRALLLKRAKEMLERGLLHTDKVRFGTTALGWRFLDSVLAGLLQDQNS